MNTNQGCPGEYCPLAALVGWLGLMWAMDLGLSEVAGQLGYLEHALVYAFKGEHKPYPSDPPTQRVFQQLP